MPDDAVNISVEEPDLVTVGAIFPSGIGTIIVGEGADRKESAVSFLCTKTIGDYQHQIDSIVIHAIHPGQAIQVVGSGLGRGEFKELPVIEVLVNGGDKTLSEHIIGLGYAIPRQDLIERHLRRENIIGSLAKARADKMGAWHEYDADPMTYGLMAVIAKETAPPQPVPEWIYKAGFILLIVAFICTSIAIGRKRESNKGVKRPLLARASSGVSRYVFGIYPVITIDSETPRGE